MDTFLQAIVMGIVQGLSEFLPISSSGHLVLVPYFLHWTDPFIDSPAFSVVLHMGTLGALLAYFWRDWARLVPAGLAVIRDRSFRGDPDRRLAWLILVSMPPAIIVGVLLSDLEKDLSRPVPVAVALVIGAGILWAADRLGRQTDDIGRLGFGRAFFIGCAQAIALIPGISRSGISISAGLATGLTREAAARFSFLIATPVIAGAGAWEIRKLLTGEAGVTVAIGPLVAGFVAALVSGLAVIAWLLSYLRSHPMTVFVGYRLVLAAIVVVYFLGA